MKRTKLRTAICRNPAVTKDIREIYLHQKALVYVIQQTSGLYLFPFGHGDDERFARIFSGTWKKIRLRIRRQLLEHWRGLGAGWLIPQIELLGAEFFQDAIGQCGRRGALLKFHGPVVDAMPEWCVECLIAHELAHVLQHAWGEFDNFDVGEYDARSFEFWHIEEQADEIAFHDLGFDVHAFSEWKECNQDLIRRLAPRDLAET